MTRKYNPEARWRQELTGFERKEVARLEAEIAERRAAHAKLRDNATQRAKYWDQKEQRKRDGAARLSPPRKAWLKRALKDPHGEAWAHNPQLFNALVDYGLAIGITPGTRWLRLTDAGRRAAEQLTQKPSNPMIGRTNVAAE